MSFYFYDLETTGLDPFKDRIMQFGGQSLDDDLHPAGELEEFYVKLSEDILPHPQAIITHRILPQTANLEGLSEYQFLNWLEENVYSDSTIYGGYNTINFDNQFMRWLHWRNFAPVSPMLAPSASLDIYKLLRLTADLRPEGMNWPRHPLSKKPSLTLGALTAANQIEHNRIHSAAGDVSATIALAHLVKKAQPKLFAHFMKLLQSSFIKEITGQNNKPFIHSHYNNLFFGASTTLAVVLAEHPTKVGCFIIYDLRQNIASWQKLNAYDLSLRLKKIGPKDQLATPFSILDINQSPAVAPASVLDAESAKRLNLNRTQILKNWRELQKSNLAKTVSDAYLKLSNDTLETSDSPASFEISLAKAKISEADEQKRQQVRAAKPSQIAELNLQFDDPRFKDLQLLYQARNFPKTLKIDQLFVWEKYKRQVLSGGKPSGLDIFKRHLRQNLVQFSDDAEVFNILEELQSYVENILPEREID